MERLRISSLIAVAEEETAKAQREYIIGDLKSEERLQKCLDTLEALKIMKERGVPDSLKDG